MTNLSEMYSDIIRFLEQPGSYPHQPARVNHIQTHISHAFIASPFVYKIKKPVDFGFLDYSTLDKRRHFCRREVELNRRLCSEIYLGVVPVRQNEDGFSIDENGGNGRVVEYAVKMKKLPEENFLYSYIEDNALTDRHLDRVADKLAEFYLRQDPPDEVLEWGRIEKIKINTDENFSQTEPFIGRTIDRNAFSAIRRFTDSYYERRQSLFRRRMEEKRIVDGHGDLHLEHIHITADRICIYDCIEFNERFRYGDLASDLAFLAMDLDFRGCWKEERYFIDRMARLLKDSDLHRILDFYKCYRAFVKGKVKSLQSDEEEVPEEERRRSAGKASSYFNLSLKYALLGSRPTLLIFMGRVGTGKSTLAGRLAETLKLSRFSSDIIRKKMAGLPLADRTPESKRDELYSGDMSGKTYKKLFEYAEEQLQESESVILDATYSNRTTRDELVRKLEAGGIRYLFIETMTSDAIIKKRLHEREQKEEIISDARIEDFDMLSRRYQPPTEIDSERHIQIDTGQPLEESLKELYLNLADRHVNQPDF